MTSTGERVRRARTAAGLDQKELAARAGVSASTLSRIERDLVGVGLETAVRLAVALRVPASTLVEGLEAPTDADPRTRARTLLDALPDDTVELVVRLLEKLAGGR
jgi:transcriptional regulator with XRE-family HTH domain